MRVDKATITDPEDDEVGADDSNHTHSRGCQRQHEQKQQQPRKIKQKGRLLASVLQSLRNVFQWTTTSIGSGMKQSESFLVVDNGKIHFFLIYQAASYFGSRLLLIIV